MNPEIDDDVQSMLLDDERICQLTRVLKSRKGKTAKLDFIWEAFCATYPDLPSGRERRAWLKLVLEELDATEAITLPVPHGKQWDRTSDIALPTRILLNSEGATLENYDWRNFAWNQRLEWLYERKHIAPSQLEFLFRVNRGLAEGWFDELESLKYRSLQLTGDEKRLLKFARTRLFGPGRLYFELLGCELEMLPIAYERISNQPTMLMFENAAPFISARQIARESDGSLFRFGVIAYGAGKQILKSVNYLNTILPAIETVFYVGDLDAEGIQIASDVQRSSAKVAIKRATEFHKAMLESAKNLGHSDGWPTQSRQDVAVSPNTYRFIDASIRQRCSRMIESGRRIPEETLSRRQIAELLLKGQ